MAELVNDRVPDLADCLPAIARVSKDRASKNHDLIGERRLRAEDAEELVVVVVEKIEIVIGRLLFDDYRDVVEKRCETLGQLAEGLLDELLEFAGRNHQPGMMLNPNTQPVPGRWNGLA